ncbi:MAG: cell division protein ZipA [Halofilum sp. (in: g-proteobacteria)]|nr:cell division protein ZipA [Halofilum sp. (in: g-proteobacteria)]
MDWLRWILLLIGAAIVVAIWWTGYRRTRERDETLFERARRDSGDDAIDPSPSADEEGPPAAPEPDLPPDLDVASFQPFPADERAPDLDVGSDSDAPSSTANGGQDDAAVTAEPPPEASPQRTRPARSQKASAGRKRTAPSDAEDDTDREERIESVFLVASGGERLVGSRLQDLFSRYGLRHGEMGIFHLRDSEGHVQFSVANLVEPGTFDPATMDTLSTPGVALFVRLPGPPSAEIAFDRMIRTARSMAEELEARLLDQRQSTLTRQTEQHLRDQMRAWDHHNRRGRA